MKKILLLLSFFSCCFSAEYSFSYKNTQLGNIKDLNTVSSGYLKSDFDKKLSSASGFNNIILFEQGSKPLSTNSKLIEDQTDMILLIKLFNELSFEKDIEIETDRTYLAVKCIYNNCKFIIKYTESANISKGTIKKSKSEILSLCEETSNVCITRKD